jgi:hypothetical protein
MRRIHLILVVIALVIAGFIARLSYYSYASITADGLSKTKLSTTTTTQLNNLNQYVTKHTGSSVKVVLSRIYNDAVTDYNAQQQRISNSSAELYAQAQAACNASHAISTVQAACNQAYIAAHPQPADNQKVLTKPVLSNYTYNLVSPVIALDLATTLFFLAAIIAVWLVLSRFKVSK